MWGDYWGRSVPDCSATMYAAYQVGHCSSRTPPLRASCSPWAVATRISACSRSCTEPNDVAAVLMRPGSRVVTSWSSQVLPSGSANVASGAVARGLVRYAGHSVRLAAGNELSARPDGVEDVADLRTVRRDLVAGGLDVGHDQVEPLGRTGLGGGDLRPELHRGRRARRVELDDPEAVVEGEVRVGPPAEAGVEVLGAVHVGDGDNDGLELEVLDRVLLCSAGVGAGDCGGAHLRFLLGCLVDTAEPPPPPPVSHQ